MLHALRTPPLPVLPFSHFPLLASQHQPESVDLDISLTLYQLALLVVLSTTTPREVAPRIPQRFVEAVFNL